MLHIEDNLIYSTSVATPTYFERITIASIVQLLLESGYRPAIASAVADNALSSATTAKALARQVGLIAPVETDEARDCGLIR